MGFRQDWARSFLLGFRNGPSSDVAKRLAAGDELCRGRTMPMSSELTEKVIDIYDRCETINRVTALMLALKMGLMNVVWGFIECAIQTNTNLLTGQKGDEYVQEFFWVENKQKQTAFDIAFENDHLDVAMILLKNAPRRCLTSQGHRRGKALIQLIKNDPMFDCFAFELLEVEKERETSTSTAVQIDTEQELKIYNEGVERLVTPEFLDSLGNSLLGLNPSNNTVLHLVSKIGNMACVEYILENHPSQIYSKNSDMETPAYVAAKEGREDILLFMINILKQRNEDIESLVTRSIDKNNALHSATKNHHVDVIFMLIEEIPQLANSINEFKESPVYLAAERGYFGVVNLMLNKCDEISFEGPNGKTALHAAAISDSSECIGYLLNRQSDLLNAQDKQGLTPLYHAVYHNSWLAVKKLLDKDYSIGYQELITKDSSNSTSAIHLAASLGHCKTMEVLMDKCPGCSEFVDDKGRNILHVVIENKRNKAIEFIFQYESLTNLINQRDKNGNTPVHLLVAYDFDLMRKLMDSRVDINVLNNDKLTPLDTISSYDKRMTLIKAPTIGTRIHNKTGALSPKIKKSGLNEIECEAKVKIADLGLVTVEKIVIVDALIATASYAAAFTVPGGFNSGDGSKQGTPFLLRKPAFQAFVVTNTIAFSLSCSVLLGYIALLVFANTCEGTPIGKHTDINWFILNMYFITTWGLFAMIIAFVTGVYVVLTPSLGLAIFVCVLTLLLTLYHMYLYSFKRNHSLREKETLRNIMSRLDAM